MEAGEPLLQILTQRPQIVREGHTPHGQMVGSGAKGAAGHVLLAVRRGDGPLPQTHLSRRETQSRQIEGVEHHHLPHARQASRTGRGAQQGLRMPSLCPECHAFLHNHQCHMRHIGEHSLGGPDHAGFEGSSKLGSFLRSFISAPPYIRDPNVWNSGFRSCGLRIRVWGLGFGFTR